MYIRCRINNKNKKVSLLLFIFREYNYKRSPKKFSYKKKLINILTSNNKYIKVKVKAVSFNKDNKDLTPNI